MRERIKTIALAAVCLALAGLLVWQLWPEYAVNPLEIDVAKVSRIRYSLDHGCISAETTDVETDDRGEIERFCAMWNNSWMRPVKAYQITVNGVDHPINDIETAGGDCGVTFIFEDGSERLFRLHWDTYLHEVLAPYTFEFYVLADRSLRDYVWERGRGGDFA